MKRRCRRVQAGTDIVRPNLAVVRDGSGRVTWTLLRHLPRVRPGPTGPFPGQGTGQGTGRTPGQDTRDGDLERVGYVPCGGGFVARWRHKAGGTNTATLAEVKTGRTDPRERAHERADS